MRNRICYLVFLVLLISCSGSKTKQPKDINLTEDTTASVNDVVLVDTTVEKTSSVGKTKSTKSTKFTNAQNIKKIMNFLAADELNGRDTGEEGIASAASFIVNEFKKQGVRPYFKYYLDTLGNFKNGTAYNVVGVLPGTDSILKKQFVVIGAHYDHIGLIAPQEQDSIANGANDNASGTTTVLQLASYFAKEQTNKRTLLICLFSAEEKGLLGSKHLAEKLKQQDVDVYTMLNFEMVGVPMIAKDHSLYVTGYKRSNLAEVSNRYAGKNLVGYLPKAKENNLFRRSDNAPFHDVFNVPSQTYCSFDFTNFDHYHKVGDELDKIDFEFMANVVNDMIPVVKGIANSEERELKYN